MHIIFDVGATKMRFSLASGGKLVGRPVVFSTPKSFSEGLQKFRQAYRVLGSPRAAAVAGGVPGPLAKDKTRLLKAPNLPGWNKKPLEAELRKIFRADVFLENDTALVGLGEAVRGAGKGKRIVAYLTVSTGVNGAKIVGGRIDDNASGFEIGQQILPAPDSGKIARLEDLVSGSSFIRRFGKEPKEITSRKIWLQAEEALSLALNNLVVYWSPEVVVIGGGIALSGKISFSRLASLTRAHLKIFPAPPIKKAKLGDSGGLAGAAYFINVRRNKKTAIPRF